MFLSRNDVQVGRKLVLTIGKLMFWWKLGYVEFVDFLIGRLLDLVEMNKGVLFEFIF